MHKYLCGFLYMVICAIPSVSADTLRLKNDAPERYVVKKGDTLWDISSVYLQSPWKWPELWGMNEQIENPHLIYPGDVLKLEYGPDGQPRLLRSGQTLGATGEEEQGKKIVKLSPGKRIEYKNYEAINTLPLHLIAPYLSHEIILYEADYRDAPMVMGGETNTKNKVQGDLIYGSGALETLQMYGIYRPQKVYEMGGLLTGRTAHELILVGTARVIKRSDNDPEYPAKLTVLSSRREIRLGDKLIPLTDDKSLPARFSLRKPENKINANILAASSNVSHFSKLEVVIIDAGQQDGLQPGHVLAVQRQSPEVVMDEDTPQFSEDAGRFSRYFNQFDLVREFDMPYEQIGSMVVFKVYQGLSYALIVDASTDLKVGDEITLPH
ncbi:LysM peptidoglycan-binding domain-containing protein [Gayadomonas joobiniege]|uniref:LysM peptidoglycan-binding domain-containing protein n=1 Tax=Gayadomonas joobiniege TaxID=1234606 RepID=UPI0003795677|nr:LysM domain-containing protein [Gayadomonas joobiniege]